MTGQLQVLCKSCTPVLLWTTEENGVVKQDLMRQRTAVQTESVSWPLMTQLIKNSPMLTQNPTSLLISWPDMMSLRNILKNDLQTCTQTGIFMWFHELMWPPSGVFLRMAFKPVNRQGFSWWSLVACLSQVHLHLSRQDHRRETVQYQTSAFCPPGHMQGTAHTWVEALSLLASYDCFLPEHRPQSEASVVVLINILHRL